MSFEFLDPGDLQDDDLRLFLITTEIDTSGDEALPTYRFRLEHAVTGEAMGFINLRIGFGANTLLYRGHIGYGVDKQFRGNRLAERACRLLLPLAQRHGLNSVWITCNPDNIASRRTCERLGAELVETIVVPEGTEAYCAGARAKCRYLIFSNCLI
jgi:tagatose 1,6-diphosphate aldolase